MAEELFEKGLCLPSGSSLTEEEQSRVIEAVEECRPRPHGRRMRNEPRTSWPAEASFPRISTVDADIRRIVPPRDLARFSKARNADFTRGASLARLASRSTATRSHPHLGYAPAAQHLLIPTNVMRAVTERGGAPQRRACGYRTAAGTPECGKFRVFQ